MHQSVSLLFGDSQMNFTGEFLKSTFEQKQTKFSISTIERQSVSSHTCICGTHMPILLLNVSLKSTTLPITFKGLIKALKFFPVISIMATIKANITKHHQLFLGTTKFYSKIISLRHSLIVN